MAVLKCKMCGGDLNFIEGASTAQCEFCGSVQTVPKVDDEKKLIQFERAERLRKQCEFDKAAGIYESIIADFRQESEAYWGLVLCKYGIEYVDDPATGKKIPTCHRSSFDSILEDSDFDQAMENADSAAQKVYREEAKKFERIRKGILEVSSAEKPYDIFICYKETDENGDRTLDSVLAQDLYSALTDKGYRVFFSRITLQGKLGEAYEPYIFAALNSAKVMLAVGTCYEYYNAVWVKNEWSRYIKLCQESKEKHLIPCYKDLDPEDMPKEFNHLQGADLGKMGAVQDILFNMEKYIPLKTQTKILEVQQTAQAPATDALLKRVFMFLEDEDWKNADEYCEKVLDIDPECSQAYLGKLMVNLKVSRQEFLKDQEKPFDSNNNYQKAIRFGDDLLKASLESYLVQITKQEEEARIAREKREEEARVAREEQNIAAEKKRQTLMIIREKLQSAQLLLSAGDSHTVGLNADGTVVAMGYNGYGQCDVSNWRNVVAITAGNYHTVGLKIDGTVVATKYTYSSYRGQCDVAGWKNIIAIAAGNSHTVGLKVDGTVVATKFIDSPYEKYNGQCAVYDWKNVVSIAAGHSHTVGLKADGTVVAVGENECGQCKVGGWENIVSIAAGNSHTVGLKADGTVVVVGYGRHDVTDWKDVVAISAGGGHTVGLKADGTVVTTGCDITDWKDVIAISAGCGYTVGLKADGTMEAVGENEKDQCNVTNWRLFKNYDEMQRCREAELLQMCQREEEMRQHRDAGLCQYCGGQLKGLFAKRCVSCGKSKDY